MMKKKILTYLILFCSIFWVGCEDSEVNWSPTYESTHNIPYGTQILRKELPKIFPDSHIENIKISTSEFFEEIQYEGYHNHYFFIQEENLHSMETWQQITEYVFNGGSAFLAISFSNTVLLNDLGISVQQPLRKSIHPSISVSLMAGSKEQNYEVEKVLNTAYISNYNPETTDVLGYVTYKGEKHPNFVKIYHGNGYFMVNTTPSLFTNYQMLKKNNYQYAVQSFSYLEDADIFWDNHRMMMRASGEKNDGGFFNGLSYILKHQSLRWAFFLLLGMGILYLFFNSKRRQRAVPIILPYPNYTLDFAKTLSELYRYNTDHTAMVKYKINYFLDQIKQKYNITAKDTEKDYSELLSSKSGVDFETCSKIVLTIDIFKTKNYLDKEDFYKLQSLIESFKKKANHYGRVHSR